MTPPKKLTKTEERKVYEVGRRLEHARLALRLAARTAAERTVTSSRTGHMTHATWRRAEQGFIQTSIGGRPVLQVHMASPETYMAMAEVVGLDGAELCRELGLKPPPPREHSSSGSEVSELRALAREFIERLDRLERAERKPR